jgi:hypothetical protein
MTLAISTTEIRVPRSKGKVNGKTVSKGKYVEYHLREWLRSVMGVITEKDLGDLAETVTNLVLRYVDGGVEVKLKVVLRYCGVLSINGAKISYYNFDLGIFVGGKHVHTYQLVKKRPEVYVDNSVDSDNYVDFAFIANYVSVIGNYDFWEETFANIVNYVVNSVRVKPRVNAYDVSANVTEFLAFLNEYTDVFYDRELRDLVNKRFLYYWYRYLRNSGYFTVYRGDIE